MRQQRWGLWFFAVAALVGMTTPVRAEFDTDGTVAKVISTAVITCIRPSTALADKGYEPQVVTHKYTSPRANRVDLEVKMRWYGVFTQSPYESNFTVKLYGDKDSIEILGIDYTDDCLIPAPDQRLLNALVRELNKKFRRE